ncbi:MAG: zinc ribbon domain-containing protein [Cellvibrionaceae bacterium]
MPIYEYQCESCDHQMEALQKMSDSPLTDCPECGKASLKKLISAAGFRLKGSGWYESDFKTGNKKNMASSDNSGGGSGNAGTGNSCAGCPTAQ